MTQTAAWTPGNADQGKKLVEQFECSRCHEGTGVAGRRQNKHCIHCHQDILAGKFKAPAAVVAKWKPNVEKFRDVPSFTVDRQALRARSGSSAIILEPKDLRPNLVQNMPRLKLSKEQARDIVTYLVEGRARQTAPAAGPEGDSTTAASSSRRRVAAPATSSAACRRSRPSRNPAKAPKSSSARSLSRPICVTRAIACARNKSSQWIIDPKSIKPDTLMTPSPLTPPRSAQHRGLRAHRVARSARRRSRISCGLPVLTRKVSFEEVNSKILMRTCRHCHGDPDSQLGDGGPGNTGGFGFKPRGLNLSHHRGAMSGLIDDHGERQSAFQPLKNGTPRIIGALLARHAEEVGQTGPRSARHAVRAPGAAARRHPALRDLGRAGPSAVAVQGQLEAPVAPLSAYRGAAEAPVCIGLEAAGAAGDGAAGEAGGAAGGAGGIALARFRTAPLSIHVQLQVSFCFVRPFVHVSQSST